MIKGNKNCTFLVNSCDKYSDVWPLFFSSLKENYKDIPYNVVLNTESLSYEFEGIKIKTFSLYEAGQEVSWGKRMIETLENIDTEYIFFVMDDFVLESQVIHEYVDKCMEWMNKDKSIAAFYFLSILGPNIEDGLYENFELLPQRKDYKLNSSPGIWRREKLIQYTGTKDSPWAWEFFGSARTYKTDDKFYCAKVDFDDIYKYKYSMGGAIHRGKWVKSVVQPLLEKYSLNIDLSIRGLEDENWVSNQKGSTIKQKAKFFKEGYRMIGFDSLIYVYRSLKKYFI